MHIRTGVCVNQGDNVEVELYPADLRVRGKLYLKPHRKANRCFAGGEGVTPQTGYMLKGDEESEVEYMFEGVKYLGDIHILFTGHTNNDKIFWRFVTVPEL